MQSWSIVLLTSLFTGMVISLESAVQAVQYGFGSLVGAPVAFGSVRELGRCSPRSSSRAEPARRSPPSSARWSSPSRSKRSKSLGFSPARMLGRPATRRDARHAAGAHDLGRRRFDRRRRVDRTRRRAHLVRYVLDLGAPDRRHQDVLKGLIKTVVFAIIIVLVGSYQGLRTRGGAAGVGISTTGSVVISIILIFISNFLLSYILFGGSRRRVGAIRPARRRYLPYDDASFSRICASTSSRARSPASSGSRAPASRRFCGLLNGLRKANSGHVYVQGQTSHWAAGKRADRPAPFIGFSFQFAALFDSLSVYENVALPLRETTRLSGDRDSQTSSPTRSTASDSRARRQASGGAVRRHGQARRLRASDHHQSGAGPVRRADDRVSIRSSRICSRIRSCVCGRSSTAPRS